MEWMKIGEDTYIIDEINTQFTLDQKHIKSTIYITDKVSEQSIMDIYQSGKTFDFETKKWKYTGARVKSITFDTSVTIFEIISQTGGMKSLLHERDKRIDELLGYETPELINDINTEPKNHK
jgi:hypothetical protein